MFAVLLAGFSGAPDCHACGPNKQAGSLDQTYREWVGRGEKCLSSGDFSSAAEAYQKGKETACRMADAKRQVDCLMKLGEVFWSLGDLGKSHEAYQKANVVARGDHDVGRIEQSRLALDIERCYREGKDLCNSSQFKKSIDRFLQGIQLSRKLLSPTHEAKCLRWMSVAHFEQNDLKSFFNLNQRALEIYIKLKNDRERGYCLFNIGLYYKKRIEISFALKYFFEAFDISRNLNSKSGQIDCFIGLGDTYVELGNLNKAIACYYSARRMLNGQSQIALYPNYLLNMGVLYRRKAEYSKRFADLEKALECYYEALNIVWQTGDKKLEASVLNNIGYAQIKLGEYQRGLANLRSGYFKAASLNNSELMGNLQINQGSAFLGLGKVEEASLCFENGIRLASKTNACHLLWEGYWGLGKCYDKMNNVSAAEACYENSLSLIRQMWDKLYLDSDKAGFVRDKLGAHESLLDLLFRQSQKRPDMGLTNKMLSVVEKAKAQAFLENIKGFKPDAWQEMSPEMKRNEAMISTHISSLMSAIARPQLLNTNKENLWRELTQWEDMYARLMSQLWPVESRLFRSEPCKLSQVQSYLHDHKAAALEYFLGEERSYVIFLTEGSCDVWPLPPKNKIEDSIKIYIKMLSSPPSGEFHGKLAARRLFHELLFPLRRSEPGKIENLVIIPDGLLYYLPFETLTVGSDVPGFSDRYLIENYNVSYAPSITSLLFISGAKGGSLPAKGLFALGDPDYRAYNDSQGGSAGTPAGILRDIYLDQGFSLRPLPFTQKEVRDISLFFPRDRTKVLLHEQASEEAVKRTILADYRVIHFACHGFLDEQFPMRSALVLSPARDWKEDGFLQVREIYGLRTRAEMIVLSACQTGKGSLERGEGLLGLPRVFFYIGARTVVSALWQISDQSTSLLMKYFYSGLARGLSKSGALREAKLKMLASAFAHPFYWASFVLNGDFDSTVDCR
jgi:CHAT domain-containing protein